MTALDGWIVTFLGLAKIAMNFAPVLIAGVVLAARWRRHD